MTRVRSPSIGTGLAALVLTAVVCVPGAQADPTPPTPVVPGAPSAADVQAAQDRAGAAEDDVAAIQQRLADAAAELDGATIRAAQASEAWNGARWAAHTARAAERRAIADSTAAAQALAEHEDAFRDAVITAQGMGLELSLVEAIVDADGVDALLEQTSANEHVQALFDQRRDEYLAASTAATEAADAAAAASAEADRALADARTARDRARAAAREAETVTARIESRRSRLVKRLARLQGVSIAVARAHQAAVDAEAAAKAAADAKAAKEAKEAKEAEAAKGGKGDAPTPATDPAPADGAQAAIAFARAQLGEPYRWGAAGPAAWDCSGLVEKAWAAGGKSLPHYSVAQYEQSTPITRDQLRPGDLVFWSDGGPGAIFHVALYVGGGQIIHAPRTGRPVSLESIDYWRTPDLYARP
ncbi:hypothetical protein GCM10023066_10120 [Nocardioides kongjuensis]